MSTLLDLNLFVNALHRKHRNQRQISDPQIIYDEALCDNIMSGSREDSSSLDDEGIVDLPLYAIIYY